MRDSFPLAVGSRNTVMGILQYRFLDARSLGNSACI